MAIDRPGALPRGGQIDRPRLVHRLERRFEVRLTTIVGGGGSGKTTLLAQAMTAETGNVDVWYPCEAADASPDHLRAGVLAACQRRLGGDPEAPEGDPIEQIADLVLSASPRHVCLVLDDTQLLGDPVVLADLLTRLPSNGHVLFAGRRTLTLATARLDAGGQLEQITQADLMMTPDEVVEFANLRGVDADRLAGAEGWPAFVELATRVDGTGHVDYLEQEAIASLDPDRRRGLAALALVGGGNDEVARALTGQPLAVLVEELPLVRWSGGWAQLHDLWGELLSDDLDGDERNAAAVIAAQLARHRGDVERAIALCTEHAAWDELLATLEHAVERGVVGGLRPQLLSRWRSSVPSERADAPVSRLLDGLVERERDPTTDEANAALDDAAAGFHTAGNPELELVALSHLGYVARISGVEERVLAVRERIESLGRDHPPAAAFAPLCDAWVALVRGDPAEQLGAIERVDSAALPELWRATCDHLYAHALSNLGRPHEALAAVPRDIEGLHLAIPGALSTELGCHWWAGHPEVIHEWPTDGVGADYGARDRFVTNALLAVFRAYAGEVHSARRLVASAEEGAGESPGALIAGQLFGVRLVIDIVEGREHEAAGTVQQLFGDLPRELAVHLFRGFLTIPYVLVPDSRPIWHDIELGPALVENRELAAAFVAAREGDLGPLATMHWPEPGFIAGRFPVVWAVEYAVHGARAGRYEAQHLAEWLCEHWGRPARRALTEMAKHPDHGAVAIDLLARTPAPPEQPVALRVIGETRLVVNDSDTADPNWRRERVRALLVWLVLHPDTSRNRAAAALWPDLEPDRAAKNLRTTLNYLHGVLEPQRAGGDAAWFVRSDGQQIVLHHSLDVDLWRFTELLDRSDEAERLGKPAVALPVLVEAAQLWRGDLAADIDHEWLDLERIHLRGRFVRAACRAAELLVASGRPDEAVEIVRPAVEVDPWNERAYTALAEGYRAMGDLTSARAVLDHAEAQLAGLDD